MATLEPIFLMTGEEARQYLEKTKSFVGLSQAAADRRKAVDVHASQYTVTMGATSQDLGTMGANMRRRLLLYVADPGLLMSAADMHARVKAIRAKIEEERAKVLIDKTLSDANAAVETYLKDLETSLRDVTKEPSHMLTVTLSQEMSRNAKDTVLTVLRDKGFDAAVVVAPKTGREIVYFQ